MKKILFLSLSFLVAGNALVPCKAQALTEKQTAALVTLTGPAVFGLYKLGKFIKNNATAKKTAKTVGKGLGALTCASGAVDFAMRYASDMNFAEQYQNLARGVAPHTDNYATFCNRAYEFNNSALPKVFGAFALGLAACLFAQSFVNDVKAEANNN